MAYLDDPNGRPVMQKFLDMMALKPQLQEEVRNALHKLAEMKLRPEKIPEEEDVVIPVSWKNIKEFPYLDPVPSSMLHADIRELSAVDIDWKMLTLDRPETLLDINIFSRMVYLDKLMMKCIVEEKEKKDKEKFIRLRTKGKMKPPCESDVDKSDEFTYEYFSRFYGSSDRAQAMDEIQKPAADDSKARAAAQADNLQASKALAPAQTKRTRRLRDKKKTKRRKKRKKNCKKGKLRKRKVGTKVKSKVDQRIKKFRHLAASSLKKTKKSKILPVLKRKPVTVSKRKTLPVSKGNPLPVLKKKPVNLAARGKKKPDSSKTLIQMLKTSEQDKKKAEKRPKSQPSER